MTNLLSFNKHEYCKSDLGFIDFYRRELIFLYYVCNTLYMYIVGKYKIYLYKI